MNNITEEIKTAIVGLGDTFLNLVSYLTKQFNNVSINIYRGNRYRCLHI